MLPKFGIISRVAVEADIHRTGGAYIAQSVKLHIHPSIHRAAINHNP